MGAWARGGKAAGRGAGAPGAGPGPCPALFLRGCQQSRERKSSTRRGKADILTSAPEEAFKGLFLWRGEPEGRSGDPRWEGPFQAPYFFLWAWDGRRGGGLKHEGVCTELSRAFLPFSLAVLCCDVSTCSSQQGKEAFGSGEEHPCRRSPLACGAPLGHQWRLPTENRGSPSPGLARREQESRVWPEAVAGPTQGMFIAHGGQMCCHLLQPCNIRPTAIGKGNQRCLVTHLRTAAEAKNGCLFSLGFFFFFSPAEICVKSIRG